MTTGPGPADLAPEEFRASNFLGLATLRRGIELSRNLMTIAPGAGDRHGQGRRNIRCASASTTTCRRFLANSLGSGETTLLKQVTGYSEFVNGGKKVIASLIDRIQDRNGKTIWRHDGAHCDGCNSATGTASPSRCSPTRASRSSIRAPPIRSSRCCEGVVQRGTGRSVLAVGKPLAGKTGTSNEAKDVWFVGFSPDLVCGVFVGFDNPRTLGGSSRAPRSPRRSSAIS